MVYLTPRCPPTPHHSLSSSRYFLSSKNSSTFRDLAPRLRGKCYAVLLYNKVQLYLKLYFLFNYNVLTWDSSDSNVTISPGGPSYFIFSDKYWECSPYTGQFLPSVNSNQVESIKPKFLVTPAPWRHRSPRESLEIWNKLKIILLLKYLGTVELENRQQNVKVRDSLKRLFFFFFLNRRCSCACFKF